MWLLRKVRLPIPGGSREPWSWHRVCSVRLMSDAADAPRRIHAGTQAFDGDLAHLSWVFIGVVSIMGKDLIRPRCQGSGEEKRQSVHVSRHEFTVGMSFDGPAGEETTSIAMGPIPLFSSWHPSPTLRASSTPPALQGKERANESGATNLKFDA